MACRYTPMGNGILCGFYPTILYKGFLFEWHAFCGPMEMEQLEDEHIGIYHEPTNKPSTDEFYEAAQEWHNLPEKERDQYRIKIA